MKVTQMTVIVIDDNNTSQPIAASDVYKRQDLTEPQSSVKSQVRK